MTVEKRAASKIRYAGWYTLLFAALAVLVFLPFIRNGKSLIWTGQEQDGLYQHYTALVYFGRWGRELLHNIFVEHTLTVPLWDMSIGYGSDILTTLHYYVIGAPLNLLSIFVSEAHTELLYNVLIVLRLYLAGASFSLYCLYQKKSAWATLAGALSYAFCGYCLYAAVRHPYFADPMIYFPLLAMGAEKIIKKERPTLFIGVVFLSAISNFYFYYMLVIAIVFYVTVRFLTTKHEETLKELTEQLISFAAFGFVGTAMAAVLLVPVALLLLGGSRSAVELMHPLLYHFSYYERFLSSFITAGSSGYWSVLGFTAPALLSVLVLFSSRRKNTALKAGFAILTVLFLLPFAGSALNGFSYVTNRWCWLYSAAVAYIMTTIWDELSHLSAAQKRFVAAAGGIYYILLLLLDSGTSENTFVSFSILLIALLILMFPTALENELRLNRNVLSLTMLGLVLFNIALNAHYQYNEREDDYVSQFLDVGTAYESVTQNSSSAVQELADEDDSFARYEQTDTTEKNTGVLTGSSGTGYFWSLENGKITQFLREMGLSSWQLQNYSGCDRRTFLDALAGVKYVVAPVSYKAEVLETEAEQWLPYGFTEVGRVNVNEDEVEELEKKYAEELGVGSLEDIDRSRLSELIKRYSVSKNEYALPMGYTYSSYITRSQYDDMSPAQRQEALLQGILLESSKNVSDSINEIQPEYSEHTLDYEISSMDGVELLEDGSFYAAEDSATAELTFSAVYNCELYLQALGMQAEAISVWDQYNDLDPMQTPQTVFDALPHSEKLKLRRAKQYTSDWTDNRFDLTIEASGSQNTLSYSTPYYQWTTGQTDFLVNLGYSTSKRQTIRITFPTAGHYSFDELQIIAQPMSGYVEQVSQLGQEVLENVDIGTNSVTGSISLSKDKILCLSIPYDRGWTAYVDGRRTELLQANTMYMALPLSAGEHTVELRYCTYGLKTAIKITGMGFAAFALIFVAGCIKRRRR